MGTEIKNGRCVILGSAPADAAEKKFIGGKITPEDFLVCADGGYDTARDLGLKPQLLIGDLDSCMGILPPEMEAIHLPVRKDDTDMMYSLKECLRRGYRRFLILGATGGRLDHTVANLCALYYLAKNRAEGILADRQNEIRLIAEGSIELEGAVGSLVSVFPYGTPHCTVSYQGLEYPLNHQKLYSWEPVGVSNCLAAAHAVITVHQGPALVILSKENEKVRTDSPFPRKME